jgi:hypothetical protein
MCVWCVRVCVCVCVCAGAWVGACVCVCRGSRAGGWAEAELHGRAVSPAMCDVGDNPAAAPLELEVGDGGPAGGTATPARLG